MEQILRDQFQRWRATMAVRWALKGERQRHMQEMLILAKTPYKVVGQPIPLGPVACRFALDETTRGSVAAPLRCSCCCCSRDVVQSWSFLRWIWQAAGSKRGRLCVALRLSPGDEVRGWAVPTDICVGVWVGV